MTVATGPVTNTDSVFTRLLNLTRSARPLFVLTIALGFAGGIFTVLQALWLSQVIDGVFLAGWTLSDSAGLLLLLLGVILGRAVLTWGAEVSASAAALRIKRDVRRKLTIHLVALGPLPFIEEGEPGRFEDRDRRSGERSSGERNSGELSNTVIEGVEALEAYFSQYLPQIALSALVPLTVLAFVFPLDWLSGVALLLTAPLLPLFMTLIGSAAAAVTKKQWLALSRMSAYFLDIIQGLTTLKTLGRSREQVEVIEQVSDRFRGSTFNVLRVTFLSALALELVSTLSTAVVAVEIGLRLLAGRLSFEQAFFVLILAPEFYLPLRQLGLRFHAAMAGAAAAERIFALLDQKPGGAAVRSEPTAPADLQSGESASAAAGEAAALIPPAAQINFNDVCISRNGQMVLDHATFNLLPGKINALVGVSGAGKSTVVALLLRFIEPDAGEITLRATAPNVASTSATDSVPAQPETALGRIPVADWRRMIAWVPQQPYLFNDTIAANLRLAQPDGDRADKRLDEALQNAARLAHAEEFICQLPQGYDTVIGERGTRLSGGQAQRIALARAFLKDAPILILDEATSHLDAITESLVSDGSQRTAAAERLMYAGCRPPADATRRTVVVISHRLASVAAADQIILLDQGRVIATGSHADLLQSCETYRRLMANNAERAENTGPITDSDFPPRGKTVDPPGGDAALLERFKVEPEESERPGGMKSAARPRAARTPAPRPSPVLALLNLLLPFLPRIALSVLLGAAMILSGVGLMATSAWIIASAALHPSVAVLQVAIVGVRVFGLTRGGFRYLERLVTHDVTFRVLARLRVSFYQALEPLAPARLLGYRSGDLLSRVIGDIASLENFYVRAVAPPLTALLVGGVMMIFMAGYHPRLAVTLAAFLLIGGVGVPWLTRWLTLQPRLGAPGRQTAVRRAALSTALVDGIQGLAEVLAFGAEKEQIARVDAAQARLEAAQGQLARIGALQSALMLSATALGMWCIVALTIPMVRAGQVDGISLAVLALAAAASFEAVQTLPQAAQHLETNLQAARRLFELVDERTSFGSLRTADTPTGSQAARTLHEEGVRFAANRALLEINNLTFTYPVPNAAEREAVSLHLASSVRCEPREPGEEARQPALPALDGLSLRIPPGGRVALVGPSGAGKSTLVNLLLRFWDYAAPGSSPDADSYASAEKRAQIRLNGRPLADYASEALRRAIAVIPQQVYVFNTTIGENLALARPEATPAEIEQAARRAQIHDWIATLPQGYDTWVGEHGLRLSGGQRQRLAIARALLKEAPLLILDEPTANLDAITGRELMADIYRLMPGCSILLITHNLVGMEAMDEIVILDQGRVVERGRHADLIKGDKLYARLWKNMLQFSSVIVAYLTLS